MFGRSLFVWIIVVVIMAGCRGVDSARSSGVEESPEVEDIDLPIGVALSTAEDVKGPPIISGVSGVLPTTYPRNLPTHEPSSIVDFGTTQDGWSFVELDTASSPASVISGLRRRLPEAGWSLSADRSDSLRASSGNTSVRVSVQELVPGSRIRIEYR